MTVEERQVQLIDAQDRMALAAVLLTCSIVACACCKPGGPHNVILGVVMGVTCVAGMATLLSGLKKL